MSSFLRTMTRKSARYLLIQRARESASPPTSQHPQAFPVRDTGKKGKSDRLFNRVMNHWIDQPIKQSISPLKKRMTFRSTSEECSKTILMQRSSTVDTNIGESQASGHTPGYPINNTQRVQHRSRTVSLRKAAVSPSTAVLSEHGPLASMSTHSFFFA